MRRVSLLVLSSLVTVTVAAACGGRSPLEDPGGTSVAAGGNGGSGGGSTSPIDAGPDSPTPPPPLAACPIEAGIAWDIVSLGDRRATAASVAAIGASEVAVQFFANALGSPLPDDIEITRFSMGPSWPGDMAQKTEPKLFGPYAHGWGNLAVSPSGTELALTWQGDLGGSGGPRFRRWDIASWSPKDVVDISPGPGGESVLATAAGAGIGALGVGYGGQGYGVIWRDTSTGTGNDATPVASILDTAGQTVLGPHPVAGKAEYPGRSPSIVWSGSSYLIATACTSCAPGDALCAPYSVVISRVRPASGDLVDDSGVDFVTSIPTAAGSTAIGRAVLATHEGRTYVAWSEGDSIDPGEPRRVLVAELSAAGEVVSSPVMLEKDAPLQSRVTLLASPLGVSVTWVETIGPSVPPAEIGYSGIVTTHLSPDLEELSHRVTVPTTYWDTYGPPIAAALTNPKSLLLVWSGAPELSSLGEKDVWAARLDCAP